MVISSFTFSAKRKCVSTHKVRAQLDIADGILRGLGMCLQQAKCDRVCTRALLASLRFMNYGQGRDTPLLMMIRGEYGRIEKKCVVQLC